MMTLFIALRERILASHDAGEGTREDIAHRYRVSLGMLKKLIQQRRHTGDIAPRHHLSGRRGKGTVEYVVDDGKWIGCGFCTGICPCGIWEMVENK